MLALSGMAGLAQAQSYCSAGASSAGSAGITQVIFNTIDNSSSSTPAYTNYTAQSTTVLKGSSHDLSVKIQATGFLTNNTAVGWIDWNHDGDFDDVGETYALGTLNSGWSGAIGNTSASPLNITVPLTATSGNTRMRIRTRQGSAPSACGNTNNSEAEDYTINVMALPVCSGTPDPGNTTANDAMPCPGNSVTLDFQNHSTDLGLSYQWQSSTTGAGGPFASNGLGIATTEVTTPGAATWYRIAMTCSGNTGYSTPVWVTPTLSGACYCTPTASSDNNTGVTNVTFNTIDNSSSGAPAYTDYSAQSTPVDQGTGYPLSVRVNTNGNNTVYVKAWIDWNQNGTFDGSEEYDLGSAYGVTDGAPSGSPQILMIPVTALPGTTVMRVRARRSSTINACGNQSYSEAEDYTLNVLVPPPCTGTPDPGNTTVTNATPCPGSSVTLGFQDQVTGSGLSYQWQSSTTGAGGPFANNGLGTATTEVTTPGTATWYRIGITCSGNTGHSTPILVTPTLSGACYCVPTASSDDNTGLTNVMFNTIDNTSVGAPAYSDFSAQSTSVDQGASYPLSVRVNTDGGYTVHVKAWIDWNQNGTFDGSEEYDLGSAYGVADAAPSGSPNNIQVPLTALPGNTVMRVRVRYNSAPTACGNNTYSEAEDYTVNVQVQLPCSGTPYPGNTTASLTAPCPGADFTLEFQYPITGSGVTYQWQSSTTGAGGPFANNGLGTATTQVTNTAVPTWYQVVATCSGNPGTSIPVAVTPNALAAACYCAATATTDNATGVTNVSFNTISNPSTGDPAYSDFSAQSTTVDAGHTFALSVSANSPGFFSTAYVNVWIDWNQNGTFDASEKYDLGTVFWSNGASSGSPLNITVPVNAVGGPTIMRVRAGNGSSPGACGNMNNSEAEDYTVNVIPPHNTCATAYAVACGQTYNGNTVAVAHSMPANACPFNGAASTGGQNWWKYTPTTDESVTLSTCGAANFDTRISVFSGADCNGLTCLSMVDDSPGCAGGTGTMTFNAYAGNTYWIAVGGEGASEGTYGLTVICGVICTPPANDLCLDAIAIGITVADGMSTPAPVQYTNECATVDAPTVVSGTMPVQGVWFTFNTGAYQHALITLLDNGENNQYTASTLNYALFTGNCSGPGAAQPDAALSDAAGTTVNLLAAHTDYRLMVYNTGGSGVSGTFGLMMQNPTHNDAAITAILDPAPGLFCGTTMAPKVALLNNGDNNLTTLQFTYGLSGGASHVYNWTGNLPYGASANITLPTVPAEVGAGQTLSITTSLPNGVADDVPANDGRSVALDVGGEAVVVKIKLDANNDQGLTWEIYDETFSYYLSGGPYTAGQANTLISEYHCLPMDFGNCFSFHLYDNYGDGLCCSNGNGYWELQRPDGRVLLRDLFDGAVDGSSSPTYSPAYSAYYDHSFCLPPGPAKIANKSCGIFDYTMNSKVYCNKVLGATSYQFEFSDPDAGFIRRIAVNTDQVRFNQMHNNPLTPGVKYFVRVRTNNAGPLASAHFGTGCEVGMSGPLSVTCTELISAPNYGHSCNETRAFNTNNSFIYAMPVVGATEYQFRIFIPGEGYDETFTRDTYILQLKWNNRPPLVNGSTYNVQVNVKVGTVYSGFCGDVCAITIDNGGERPEASMEQTTGTATMWPNPVRDGQVKLSIDGIRDADQQITIDILDLYGKQVFAKAYGNNGERFTTTLDLPGDIASGTYLVHITVNGKTTVQRLSIIK